LQLQEENRRLLDESPAASVISDPPIDWVRLERIQTLR